MESMLIVSCEDFLNSYKDKSQCVPNRFLPIAINDPLLEEYSYLIGKIMGDGNLDQAYTMRFVGQLHDLRLLQKLIICKFKLNENRFSIRKRKNKGVSYILQVNYASFGRVLYLLGAPRGNKTKIAFKIPSWILTNNLYVKRFLQALLEDELTTIKIEKCNYANRPRLKLSKKADMINNHLEFMIQVKQTIESFGVQCSSISRPIATNTPDKYDLYFHIMRNKHNIIKFKEKIGFRLNKVKIEKLDNCYSILTKTQV